MNGIRMPHPGQGEVTDIGHWADKLVYWFLYEREILVICGMLIGHLFRSFVLIEIEVNFIVKKIFPLEIYI